MPYPTAAIQTPFAATVTAQMRIGDGSERTYVTKHGTEAQMNTAAIVPIKSVRLKTTAARSR